MWKGSLPAVVVAALLGAPLAAAAAPVERPPVTWATGASGGHNFTPALHRRITTIVVHATEGGSLVGNVSWLTGKRSEASSHYLVSRDGTIVQLVPLHDIAWQAGNPAVNAHSIGIEHVGVTNDPAGFTRAEYAASARLVAWLVRRYDIPVDRRHIIGHDEVPDPNQPGLFGGADHHTDPGRFWNWRLYLRLIRRDAFPPRLHVRTQGIEPGATLRGIVPWRVETRGAPARQVEFFVDGRLRWRDSRAPFAFAGGRGLNTTGLGNGEHVLAVRAVGPAGAAAERLPVEVGNRAFALTTSALHAWQRVQGVLRIRANVRGAAATVVGLYVDRRPVSRDRRRPYVLRFDTRRVHDGRHRITIAAVAADGRVVRRRLALVVSNHPRPKHRARPRPKPAPKQLPPPAVTAENLADDQALQGVVAWRAHTTGPVARVEFAVDGTVVATETRGPWATSWDTATVPPGPHALEVRAFTRDGRSAVRSITVTT